MQDHWRPYCWEAGRKDQEPVRGNMRCCDSLYVCALGSYFVVVYDDTVSCITSSLPACLVHLAWWQMYPHRIILFYRNTINTFIMHISRLALVTRQRRSRCCWRTTCPCQKMMSTRQHSSQRRSNNTTLLSWNMIHQSNRSMQHDTKLLLKCFCPRLTLAHKYSSRGISNTCHWYLSRKDDDDISTRYQMTGDESVMIRWFNTTLSVLA